MADRMLGLPGHWIDFGEIDFRGRLLVVGPESGANFVAASEQRVAQTAELLDPPPRRRQADGGAIGTLRPINAFDFVDVTENRFRRWW
jgi:hypothetical protein